MLRQSTPVIAAMWIAMMSTALASDARSADPPESVVATTFASADSSKSPLSYTTFDPKEHPGKVLYVDFWASWCAPCKKSFPFMNELAQRLPEDRFEIIGINLDKDRWKAERFLIEVDADFPTVFDPEGKIAEAYEVEGMPTTLLFDRAGKLRSTRIGYQQGEEQEILSEIESLIAEDPPRAIEH